MTEFYGRKNFLMTKHKISYSCTLFSKVRVCKSFLKTPNVPHPAVPLSRQAWGHNNKWWDLWDVWSMAACTPRIWVL